MAGMPNNAPVCVPSPCQNRKSCRPRQNFIERHLEVGEAARNIASTCLWPPGRGFGGKGRVFDQIGRDQFVGERGIALAPDFGR